MKVLRSTVVILALGAAPLIAQGPPPGSGYEPTLILSLFGGVAAGHSLWSVGQQPLCVLGPPPNFVCDSTSHRDTVEVGRTVTSSIVAGAAATYFPSPHLGYQLELYYLGQTYDDNCSAQRFDTSDVNQVNAQTCNSVTRNEPSSGAIGLVGSVMYRLAPGASVSPYLRGGVGLVAYSGGTIAMAGDAVVNSSVVNRPIYIDDSPKTTSLAFQVSAGLTVRTSPGYQLRFEARDAITELAYITGASPGDKLVPPTATKWFHNVVLTVGLDVVLEHKRGRRY